MVVIVEREVGGGGGQGEGVIVAGGHLGFIHPRVYHVDMDRYLGYCAWC